MTTDTILEELGDCIAFAIITLVLIGVLQLAVWFAYVIIVCVSNTFFRTDWTYPDWDDAQKPTFYVLLAAISILALLFLTAP